MGAPGWRRRVEDGETLSSILDEALTAVGVEVAPPREIDPAIRAEVIRWLADHDLGPTDHESFLESRPHWLIVQLVTPLARASEPNISFHAEHMTPLPGGAMALQDVREFVASMDGVRLEARERPVLWQMEQDREGLVRFVFSIGIDESEFDTLAPHPTSVEFDTLTLQGASDSSVDVSGGRIIVRISP